MMLRAEFPVQRNNTLKVLSFILHPRVIDNYNFEIEKLNFYDSQTRFYIAQAKNEFPLF